MTITQRYVPSQSFSFAIVTALRWFVKSDKLNFLAIAPKAFKIVKLSCLIRKNVDDYAAVIQKHPCAAAMPFPADQLIVRSVHCLFNGIAKRVDMRVGRAGADHKIIRQCGDIRNFNHVNIQTFLAVKRGDNGFCRFFCGRSVGQVFTLTRDLNCELRISNCELKQLRPEFSQDGV